MDNLLNCKQENYKLKTLLSQFKQVAGLTSYVDDSTFRGGYRVVYSIKERDEIPVCNRKTGMVVSVNISGNIKDYRLSESGNWNEIIYSVVETDTLQTVTSRGNSTTNNINSFGMISATQLAVRSSVDPVNTTGTISGDLFANRQYKLPDLSGTIIIDTDLVGNYLKPIVENVSVSSFIMSDNLAFNPYKSIILNLKTTSTTVQLPLLSNNVAGREIYVINEGSGMSFIECNPANTNKLQMSSSSLVSSMVLMSGQVVKILCTGSKYVVLSIVA